MREATRIYIERWIGQEILGVRILEFSGFQNRTEERNGIIKRECTFKCKCLKCESTFTSNIKKIREKRKQPCNCIREKIIRKRVPQLSFKNRLINDRFYRSKEGAKRREIKWFLSKEVFEKLSFGNCNYCGEPPSKIYLKGEFKDQGINNNIPLNGIDRVDSNKDYTEDNCVSCCHICNMAKRDFPIEVFTTWIEKLVNFNIKKFNYVE